MNSYAVFTWGMLPVGAKWAALIRLSPILSREDGSSTRAEFEKLLLGERLTTQSAQIAPSSAAMVSSVAQMPNSIGYVSMSYLDASVKATDH